MDTYLVATVAIDVYSLSLLLFSTYMGACGVARVIRKDRPQC